MLKNPTETALPEDKARDDFEQLIIQAMKYKYYLKKKKPNNKNILQ